MRALTFFPFVSLLLLLVPPVSHADGVRRRAPRSDGTALAPGAIQGPAQEGWHAGDRLICSDCHTMHNSLGGLPMRYDGQATPAPSLLRMDREVTLCLHCHDGGNPLAPDVTAPVSYLTDPAGGFFASDPGEPNPHGHDLEPVSPLPAPGSNESFVLRCSSCHALHGSANYRSLLTDPPGSADDGQVEVVVDQLVMPDGTNPQQVYRDSNLRDRSGMGEFCNSCHDNFHGKTLQEEGGTTRPWLRHPQGVPIAGSDHADFGHWSGTLSDRVRVETPTDDTIPSADDRVFCLSCHKAHGSSRPASLIYADGSRRRSTCAQCHNP